MTRWEESGYQGHDSLSLSPSRPDYEQRSAVHRDYRAFVQFINSAERKLRAAFDDLDAWIQSEVRLSNAIQQYNEMVQGFRKLVSFIAYRQKRQSIKAFCTDRDRRIIDGDVVADLAKIEEELRSRFESLCSSLAAWDEMISEARHWQGVSYWQKCRSEAIDEIASRRLELDDFRDRSQYWRNSFATWSARFRGASAASELERGRKAS